jgi:hypothetical protein
MDLMTTNGVVVIEAGKKRSEQNHALPDREFGGDNSGSVKLCLSPFPGDTPVNDAALSLISSVFPMTVTESVFAPGR